MKPLIPPNPEEDIEQIDEPEEEFEAIGDAASAGPAAADEWD